MRPVPIPASLTTLPVPLAVSFSPHPRARPARPRLSHAVYTEVRRGRTGRARTRSFPLDGAHLALSTSASAGNFPFRLGGRNETVFLRVGADDRLCPSVHHGGRGRQFGPQPGKQVSGERLPSVIDSGLPDDNPWPRSRTTLPLIIAVLSGLESSRGRGSLELGRLIARVGIRIGKVDGRRGRSRSVGGEEQGRMRPIGKRLSLSIIPVLLCGEDRRVRDIPQRSKCRRSEHVGRPRRSIRVVTFGRSDREKRQGRSHAVGMPRSTTVPQGRLDTFGGSSVEVFLVRLALTVRQVGSRRSGLVCRYLDRIGRGAKRIVVKRVRMRISRGR